MQPSKSPATTKTPSTECDLAESIKKYIEELEMMERALSQMRMQCEQRHCIWELVEKEMSTLEEQATIFRYKMDRTQNQPTEDQPTQHGEDKKE